MLARLTGQLSNLVHDRVGGDAALLAGHLLTGLLKVEWLAHTNREAARVNHVRAGLLQAVGANQTNRNHGCAGHVRQPRHTNLAAVQVAVAGAGALGVNAEDLTLL